MPNSRPTKVPSPWNSRKSQEKKLMMNLAKMRSRRLLNNVWRRNEKRSRS